MTKRNVLFSVVAGLVAASSSLWGSTVSLVSSNSFSGTVTYGNSFADWRVFSSTLNSGSAVVKAGGGGLISAVSSNATLSNEQASFHFPNSWTNGTPIASATSDPGYRAVLGGSSYAGYTQTPTTASFSVLSPSSDYTIDLYLIDWGYGDNLDLTVRNGSTTQTYTNFLSSYGWVSDNHLVIGVTGSDIGELTTVEFTDFAGNDAWGQLGFASAGVTIVPEPSLAVLAILGGIPLVLSRRRR